LIKLRGVIVDLVLAKDSSTPRWQLKIA